MPLKVDGKRRWVELDWVLPGSPEELWRALATGPGMAAWFAEAHVEERAGGTIRFELGGGASSTGNIITWEPPTRLVYEEHGWSEGAPPLATEIQIVSRSGDRCSVRMVHSFVSESAQWDDEVEGFEAGWGGFVEVLRVYLRDFRGLPAAATGAFGVTPGSAASVWKRLGDALGLRGAELGDRRASAANAPRLSGTVLRVSHAEACEVMLRLDEPMPGVALVGCHSWGDKARVGVSFFLYGAEAAAVARQIEPVWQAWLARTFAAPGSAEPKA